MGKPDTFLALGEINSVRLLSFFYTAGLLEQQLALSTNLHSLSLPLVEETPPGLMIDLSDGLDDAAQPLLHLSQEVEELLRHLRHHACN